MKIWTPEYFRHFRCIAGDCPDSCCKEWEVDVDDAAAAFYRNLEGPLGDRLRQVLTDTEAGTLMRIENGRCPMWCQDGLCRIQAELGHDALCQVCREFPRLRHDYGDFAEYGLELSCPEAARLILSLPHTMTAEELDSGELPEYDTDAMSVLLESRACVLDFLERTSLPFNEVLAVLLLYGYEVQGWLDGGEVAVLDEERCLADVKTYATDSNWELFLHFFRNLEILTPQWKMRLSMPAEAMVWQAGFLPLVKYFIGRYWLQAVSDYDLIGRVKFLISACLLICRLGGDFCQTAQLFSKEIENDPDNLESILDGAYADPALTDIQLLSLLLNP